jgi:acyl-coenzyme A synthetase/AMP-(fatty) acid ligase
VETVGKVQPHVRAKVIDREGNIVPVGTPGELCVTGYLLQKGCVSCFPGFHVLAEFGRYWENGDQTKKVMRPDPEDESVVWMHTGDEGIIDEEGYLRSTYRTQIPCVMADLSLLQLLVESRSISDVLAVQND